MSSIAYNNNNKNRIVFVPCARVHFTLLVLTVHLSASPVHERLEEKKKHAELIMPDHKSLQYVHRILSLARARSLWSCKSISITCSTATQRTRMRARAAAAAQANHKP